MKKFSKLGLMRKADQAFAKYIKKKYEIDGTVICVTCGTTQTIANIQAGHYIVRAKQATRYDERNVHPQCLICNVFRHGELPKYALYLIKTYGPTVLEELEKESRKLVKTNVVYYQAIIEKYSKV